MVVKCALTTLSICYLFDEPKGAKLGFFVKTKKLIKNVMIVANLIPDVPEATGKVPSLVCIYYHYCYSIVS